MEDPKKRILIVEDNDTNLYLIQFLLEKNNYEIIVARDGKEGIEKAKAEKPDLILMDVQLPGIDGYTATKTLKDIPELASIPVIALTSYALKGDREKAIMAGCDSYITKPLHPEQVIEEIKKFL